ncbi:hypothetical protein EI427_10410 [Flammeovirga pectinis]|uniref:Alginate export domain-containing protein n=1 Tax=Flammeovirga pectinis TaxID=2494373 RepID=A0A3Q9FP09_9BACT|nr:alginate export family protein [Flammeovirga pectinis]AZQ62635.1 hypothetical protein EI427_10410 [Flammeovirga pectinis]
MLKKLLSFTLLLLTCGVVQAQDFSIDAQLKPRYEHRNGFNQLRPSNGDADRAADFVSQRARIRMLFNDKSNKFRFGFSAQDVRTWGEIGNFANKDNGNFSIHEAWGELLFTEEFSVKAGRQEISYDDQRIFGAVDWAQQGRSHDAAVFKYEKAFKLHAGVAISATGETPYYNPGVNNYKALQYLWFNKKFDQLSISALFLNNGVEQDVAGNQTSMPADFETIYSQTLGAHGEWRPGKFGLNASFYYQMGAVGAGKTDLNAYNALVEVLFQASEGLSLNIGGEILSGTDATATDGVNRTFNPLYGTNHKFNGHMDYFYVGGASRLPQGGLTDIYLGATYKMNEWKFYGKVHSFQSSAVIVDGTGAEVGNNLGTELDLNANYKFNDYISIQGGWSAMFATESMQYSTGANAGGDYEKFNNWGWMGIVIKPTLFTTKKKEAKTQG